MHVILADGTEIYPMNAVAGKEYIMGYNRDVVTFIFDDSVSMEAIDAIFQEAACETFTIIEETIEQPMVYVHEGYTLRVGLSKEREEVITETATEEAVYMSVIKVRMAQRTYSETVLQNLQDTVDMMLLAELE